MDFLERVHGQWGRLFPGEDDVNSLLSIGRLLRVASFVTATTEDVVTRYDLTRGEFDLLCAVRRSGKNCRATELSILTKASGAAITKRLDKLSAQGLITRQVLARDRRVVLVDLTDQGCALVDEAFPQVMTTATQPLDGFTDQETEELERLLTKLLKNVDPKSY
ncbi:MarR family winged helix-turn-helix transcriptional regulator [Timonella sp. A28]|uniref:MarR family winged helix-turn-helix transcriptional regulator n=1 Tax=Timonella sp. A28 TaxID=3442640 RepID=UPI003EC13CA2